MSRLPTVGGDAGNWGEVLNDFLQQSHQSDGKLRADVATIAALKALDVSTLPDKMQVMVGGYYAHGDGGGGQFYYDQGASDTDNGGTVIAPTAGSGRWKRGTNSVVDVRTFGANGDGNTDNSTPLQNAINYVASIGGGQLIIPAMTFAYATGLVFPRAPVVSLKGVNWRDSILKYTGSGIALSFSTAVNTVVDRLHWSDFFLDCQSSTATKGIELSCGVTNNGFRWCRFDNIIVWGSNATNSVGWDLQSIDTSVFTECFSRNWKTGFQTVKSNKRVSQCTFVGCTAQECDTRGWSIINQARACRFITCRNEGRGSTPVGIGYYVDGTGLTDVDCDHVFLGCETEDEYTTADFYFANAQGVTMLGGGPGTNATGDGIVLDNCQMCTLQNLNIRAHEASGKKAIILKSASVGNTITGCKLENSADTTDAQKWARVQIDSDSTRNIMQLNFDGGASTPTIYGGYGPAKLQKTITVSSTIDYREAGTYLCDASSGAIVCTLNAITTRVFTAGSRLTFKKIDNSVNTVTIDPGGTETIDGSLTKVLSTQWATVNIEAGSNGTWYVV